MYHEDISANSLCQSVFAQAGDAVCAYFTLVWSCFSVVLLTFSIVQAQDFAVLNGYQLMFVPRQEKPQSNQQQHKKFD